MPHLVDAFERAATIHERSAEAHERAAAFFAEHGKSDAAARELDAARKDRQGAVEDYARAQRRRELLNVEEGAENSTRPSQASATSRNPALKAEDW